MRRADNTADTTMNIFQRFTKIGRDVDGEYWTLFRHACKDVFAIAVVNIRGEVLEDFYKYSECVRNCLHQYYFTNCLQRKFYERSYRIHLDRCDYISINNLVNKENFYSINRISLRNEQSLSGIYHSEKLTNLIKIVIANIARYSSVN